MKNPTKEESIQRIMKGLQCDREEAEKVYADDEAIKRNEPREFDLPSEKLKIAQSFCKTGTRKRAEPTVYKFEKKAKKENATKSGIVAELAQYLTENSEFSIKNLEIVNKERQIFFEIGEDGYELTLIKKRKSKK